MSFSEEGDARTDGWTHGGIISFGLSSLARCMRIHSNKGCPRVAESDRELLRVESGIRARRREEREECETGRTAGGQRVKSVWF